MKNITDKINWGGSTGFIYEKIDEQTNYHIKNHIFWEVERKVGDAVENEISIYIYMLIRELTK